MKALTIDEVISKCEAAGQNHPHHAVSDKYVFLSTQDIIRTLQGHGWHPVRTNHSYTRNKTYDGYQQHEITFRLFDSDMTPRGVTDVSNTSKSDNVIPQVLLVNSHNRSASFKLFMGLFRVLCSNGLVVSDGIAPSLKIKHIHQNASEVMQFVNDMSEEFPKVFDKINDYKSVEPPRDKLIQMVDKALDIRWPKENLRPKFHPESLLGHIDPNKPNDLWQSFNRIQSNLINGGFSAKSSKGDKNIVVKPIKAIGTNIKINKGLWDLMDETHQELAQQVHIGV